MCILEPSSGSALFFILIIIARNTIGCEILGFLEGLNVQKADPLPIIVVGSRRADLFYNCAEGIVNLIACVESTRPVYCNESFRNRTGMMLYKHYDAERTIHFLTKLHVYQNQSTCRNPGYAPRVFLINNDTLSWNSVVAKILGSFIRFPLVYSDIYMIAIVANEPIRITEFFQVNNENFAEEINVSEEGLSIDALNGRKRRFNFHRQVLRTPIFKASIHRYQKSIDLSVESMDDMDYLMNFSMHITYADGWMSWNPRTKSLSGLAKLLQYGEADIVIQAHELFICRMEKFDFIFPVYDFRESFIFRQQETMYTGLLFQPYALDAWIAFVICLILLCLSMLLAYKGNEANLVSLNMVGLFMQQGWTLKDNGRLVGQSVSKKVIMAVALLLSVFFYNIYSASIISMIQLRQPPIRTMDQMLNSGRTIFVDENAKYAQRFASQSVRKRTMNCSPNSSTLADEREPWIVSSGKGLEEILESTGTAFITYVHLVAQAQTFRNLTVKKFCATISQIPVLQKGLPVFHGMYVRKQSPLKRLFIYGHIARGEMGAARRQRSRYLSYFKPTCSATQEILEPLNIFIVFPAYVLLLSGIAISFLVLVTEQLCHRCHQISK